MRKYLILIIISIISSCSYFNDQNFLDQLGGGFDLFEVPDISICYEYSYANRYYAVAICTIHILDYESDSVEHWQSPKESYIRGLGDCEDYTILYMNILYQLTGEKSDLATIWYSERKIEEGGKVNHAIVRLPNGEYLDVQRVEIIDNPKIGYSYSFDEVFNY